MIIGVTRMKKKDKGQALVEFVLVLPVFMMLILAIIDFGRIIYIKNNLENKTDDALTYLRDKRPYEEVKAIINKDVTEEINISLTYGQDNYLTIQLSEEIAIFTPGLNYILSNPYEVSVERIVLYE
jgi:hypothetical protein